MFGIQKNYKIKLPQHYENLINEKDYNYFIKSCLAVLKKTKLTIISFDDGDILYKKDDGEEGHYYLDNLLRKYIQLSDNDRLEEVKMHFDKLQNKSSAYNYFFKDFDNAKQYLKVLIKPMDMGKDYKLFVHRLDIPNLLTFLVFDFENKFHYIRIEDAVSWEITIQDLFEIALQNILVEEIEVNETFFGNKFNVFVLFSGDFSASYALLIDKYLEFSIGKYGTLLAIPTKGTVFMHPIQTKDILELPKILQPEVEKFYNEDPGNISLDYYWYYQGKFYLFNKKFLANQQYTISLPEKLELLFSIT